MADETNLEVRLKHRPGGVPAAEDFDVVEGPVPVPGAGEMLCRARYLSLDPYMRGQISGRHLSGAVEVGDLMRGEVIADVVTSNGGRFDEGSRIAFRGHWQSWQVTDGAEARLVDPAIDPPSLALGILGMPGLTAYAGFLHLAEPKAGEVVMVSAASGPVGSMVGQIAKIHGCRVVGIAGGPEKCRWVVEEAGFDACIDYKAEDLGPAVERECPDGVDIYFDNVGGDVLDAVMWRLALGARIVLCGLMAQYNTDEIPPGPNPATIIKARATVRGLVVYDHEDKRADFTRDALAWLAAGKLHYREDVTEGLENAPAAFARLMAGRNFGKMVVKIA